ncbi:MAG: response regulator [Verrucomicrobiota bacterium]|nr:response regulator [Verrucomicrobiota bacterium]
MHAGRTGVGRAMFDQVIDMKTNKILLVDADGDCQTHLMQLSDELDFDLVLARTCRRAFALLEHRPSNLNFIVVDVDPGAHGLALLEAISACAERPRMIVLTALEETYMRPIALEHGAAACLGKPIGMEKLRAALSAGSETPLTCDRWGSLLPPQPEKQINVSAYFRGITQKLSPTISECAGRRS